MASPHGAMTGHTTCVIDVSPDVVDAGADITLRCKVACAPPCDLRGHNLLIRNEAGADIGSVAIAAFDGQTNETSDLVLKAPDEATRYTWLVVCPAVVKDDASYAETATPLSFSVKPHLTSIVVWDVPSAIVVGERFRIKVGIKCSNECRLAHGGFGIYDHEEALVASGTVPDDHWPGTSLYVTEVELDAPPAEGLYRWSVRGPSTPLGASPGLDVGLPHTEGSGSFGVTVVGRPEFLVKVEAIDQASQMPLTGARVVMHPYRTLTDERGIAEVRVAKGAYKLFVSQTSYLTFLLPLEVTTDTTARAELELEPVLERN